LTIAGIGLSVGGTVANYAANQRVESARNDALAAERIRQQGLDREAAALNTASQDRYQDFAPQQAETAAGLGEYFAGEQVAEPTAAEALPTSTSNITVREEQNQRQQARDFTNNQGAALGQLRSFGDLLGGIGREQARDASQIGQIGGFKTGSAGVRPYELDAASQAGNGMKFFGDVLGGLGSVGLNAGLSGRGLFGIGGMAPGAAPTQLRLGSMFGA
jgi:hypothetical protein